jgi:hypothetical protein
MRRKEKRGDENRKEGKKKIEKNRKNSEGKGREEKK